MDAETTVLKIKGQVSKFRHERDWRKYDTPKSLAISISVEAAELLEHFQWRSDDQVVEAVKTGDIRESISNELADVMIYCLGFADVLAIDVSEAIEQKLRKNQDKYPPIRSPAV